MSHDLRATYSRLALPPHPAASLFMLRLRIRVDPFSALRLQELAWLSRHVTRSSSRCANKLYLCWHTIKRLVKQKTPPKLLGRVYGRGFSRFPDSAYFSFLLPSK